MTESKTPIRDRAKRIYQISKSKDRWPWHEHKNASWEFRVLDVLWDIRSLLVMIATLLFLIYLKIG